MFATWNQEVVSLKEWQKELRKSFVLGGWGGLERGLDLGASAD